MCTLPVDIQQRLAELPCLFKGRGVCLAYLFGSLSRGDSGNDVDLALLTDGEPAMRLWPAICDWLGTERVDLVDLRDAAPTLSFEIIRSGYLLYAVDQDTCNDFEMAVLRQYKDTAWLRRNHARILRERMKQWSSNLNRLSSD